MGDGVVVCVVRALEGKRAAWGVVREGTCQKRLLVTWE